MKNFLTKLTSLPQEQRVFGLDVLRALAILGVLLTHAQFVYSPEHRGRFSNFASLSGALGVELFFVLSGFLIGSILLSLGSRLQHIETLPLFWQRRWFRTLPNYFLFLILNIVVSLVGQTPIPNIVVYVFFFQNWLWPHPPFFGQAWSLAIEEWFYLIFPISLYLLSKIFKSFDLTFIISAGIFILIPSLVRMDRAMTDLTNWDEDFRKIMFIRLDAIMYGVVAAWVKKTFPLFWRKQKLLLFLGSISILYLSLSYVLGKNLSANFFAKTFLFSTTPLGFAAILPVFDQWENKITNLFTIFIRLIALWSYSLYLCNLLVLQIINFISDTLKITSFALQTLCLFTFFIANLVISSVVYAYFEKPITDLRDSFSKS